MEAQEKVPLEASPPVTTQRRAGGHPRRWPAHDEPTVADEPREEELRDPRRWGLPAEAISTVGARLVECWQRFRACVTTHTRDPSANASDSLRGQLTMDGERNCANLARHMTGDDGQALQPCMSTSPWAGPAVFRQMQAESNATPALAQGSTLILEESADEKAGTHNAGAARPYHGRLGKVDVCRVDTCLTSATGGLWAMGEGELFLPEDWLGEGWAEKGRLLGIPEDRTCETKLPLGVQMVNRAKAHRLPCELLACDARYGSESQFRADVDAAGVRYAAQVPADTGVYLREPRVGVPKKRGTRGRPRTRLQVLSRQRPHAVRALAQRPQTPWQHVQVRLTERGWLEAHFAVTRGWTVAAGQQPRAEWLVIRREAAGECAYTLLNAPADAPRAHVSAWSCRRSFAERTCEDAKTEMGWDEFQAQQYRAWEHHVALTAAAVWFVAPRKRDWAQTYARDPELAHQLAVEVLPALSTANVRELLKAVLPLPHLTLEQAIELVMTHVINRARATSSRLKSQVHPHDSS